MASVSLVITGKDEASPVFKSVQTSVEKTTGSLSALKSAAETAAAAFGAYKLAQFAEQASMMAARSETLAVVMKVVGQNAGYTADQMAGYAQGVANMGITVEESRSSIVRMTQANLDLSKSSQLARVAQDAAVIAGMNSSQALAGIMQGITTLQPEVLRTYGIVVNFEQAYAKAATTMGKNADMLTQNEKQQIALNAVLEQGKQIAGSYEASLGTVGKAVYSLQRYISDNKAAFGELFTPVMKVVVDEFTLQLKQLGDWFLTHKETVKDFAKALADDVVSGMRLAKEALGTLYELVNAIPNKLALIKDCATLAGIALAGMATSAIVGSVVNLINKFVQLRAAILAAAAAQVTLNGGTAAAGAAAVGGAVATTGGLGVAATTGLVATVGLGAYWLTSKAMSAMGFDGGKAEYEQAQQKEREAEARWNDFQAKQSQIRAAKKNEEAAAAGRQEQARIKAQEAAFLQRQEDKKTFEARMRLMDEQDKYAASVERNAGEVQLAAMKNAYDQGLVYASTYYEAVRTQASKTVQIELDAVSKQRTRLEKELSSNSDLDAEKKINIRKDIVSLQVRENELIAKHAEQSQATNAQEIRDLNAIRDLMLDLESARLSAAGKYAEAAQKEIEKEQKTVDFLRLKAAAAAGNQDAITALRDKELAQQSKLFESHLKDQKALQDISDANLQYTQELEKQSGVNQSLLDTESKLYESKKQMQLLQDQLSKATLNGAEAEIQLLNRKISLLNLQNQNLQQAVEFEEQLAVLSGNVVGFDNNAAIGKDSWRQNQYQYQSAADALKQALSSSSSTSNQGTSSFGSSVKFISISDLNKTPFMGPMATGTNFIPTDGFAYLHKGEAVLPKAYNPAAGGNAIATQNFSFGNITIVVQGGSGAKVDSDTLARQLVPSIRKYMGRRL